MFSDNNVGILYGYQLDINKIQVNLFPLAIHLFYNNKKKWAKVQQAL